MASKKREGKVPEYSYTEYREAFCPNTGAPTPAEAMQNPYFMKTDEAKKKRRTTR